MTLFIIGIPLMIVAVAMTVVPLIVASHSDHRQRRRADTVGTVDRAGR